MRNILGLIFTIYVGVTGLISLIYDLILSFKDGNGLSFVLQLLFSELIIPLSGLINVVYVPYFWVIHGYFHVFQFTLFK